MFFIASHQDTAEFSKMIKLENEVENLVKVSMYLHTRGRFLKGGINYTRYNNYSRDKSAMPGITGVINLSQIYSLHCAIPSFRNRSYSRYKVIPGIRHIYTWNRVILPFRNRPQESPH